MICQVVIIGISIYTTTGIISSDSLTSLIVMGGPCHPFKWDDSIKNHRIVDVIIIGAGLSGLNAAKICHDSSLNVLVLEARNRVGGRTLSDDDGCDLGGAYITHDQILMMNLVHELGLKMHPIAMESGGTSIYYSSSSRKSYRPTSHNRNAFPLSSWLNIFVKLDFLNTRYKIDSMCNQVPLLDPWNAKKALEWDSKTFRQFIENECCVTDHVKQFFLNFFTLINATNEPEEVSLLYMLWYIRSWGGLDGTIGLGNNPAARVVGGSQLVSKRLMQQIGEERILLNKAAFNIDQSTLKDKVIVRTTDGSTYVSTHVIIAIPPNLQSSITHQPPLSDMRKQLLQRMPAGYCTKVILYYDKPHWSKNGSSGTMMVVQPDITLAKKDKSCNRNRSDQTDQLLPATLTIADYTESRPALVGFITGGPWVRYQQIKDVNERIRILADSYSSIFGLQLSKPAFFKEQNWVEEDFSQGAYTSTMGPGTMTKFGRYIREPVGRVWFAAAETSTSWVCSMEGAVRSGRRAARQVLQAMGRLKPGEKVYDVEDVPLILTHTFMERHAGTGLKLLRVAGPTLLLFTLALGFGLHKATFRMSVRI